MPRKFSRQPEQNDAGTALRLAHAMTALDRRQVLAGRRSLKISVRVDPGLLVAARAQSGMAGDSDLVNAALALMAAPGDFGAWLVSQSGTMSKDFEIAV